MANNIKTTPLFESDYINPSLRTSPWSTNRIFAYNLIRTLNPSKIVELGTHYGCSLFAFLQSIKDYGLNTKVVAIDTWQGDMITGHYKSSEVLKIVKNTVNKYFDQQDVTLIQSTFSSAVNKFDDFEIDILHIDGNHTFESVKEDFETWLPKLGTNGIIIMHDIGKRANKNKYGSYTYWQQIKKQYPYLEMTHDWGLGIVFPKGNNKLNLIKSLNLPYLESLQMDNLHSLQVRDLSLLVEDRDNYIKILENKLNPKITIEKKHKKKTICILLGSAEISGGTYVIFKHALKLIKCGYDVTIITEQTVNNERLKWFPNANKLKFKHPSEIAKNYYEICIATWWKTVFLIPYVNSRKYIYFVQSIESRFCNTNESQLKKIIELTYSLPMDYITEAHWIQSYLKDNYNQESKVVLNGIDKKIFCKNGVLISQAKNQGLRVLVEGALGVFFKQTETAIAVAQKAGIKDIWLLTPTEISCYPGVNKVFSKVPIEKVGTIMRSCDLLLKLSTVEGMFGPPLEMMHCGGTAITFNVTGHDEYMVDGVNSLVYEMNDFQKVINSLKRLKDDKSYLKILKQNGLQTAKEWPTWESSSSSFVSEITKIIENNSTDNCETTKYLKTSISLIQSMLDNIQPIYGIKHDSAILFKRIVNKLFKKS